MRCDRTRIRILRIKILRKCAHICERSFENSSEYTEAPEEIDSSPIVSKLQEHISILEAQVLTHHGSMTAVQLHYETQLQDLQCDLQAQRDTCAQQSSIIEQLQEDLNCVYDEPYTHAGI